MRRAFLLPVLLVAAHGVAAQAPAQACDTPEAHQLDFWLGEWDLAYTEGGKALTSRNRISKILDGCAVLEQFDGRPGIALEGRSVSAFDAGAKRWKQTWVDNTGAYLDFAGGMEDGRMVLARTAMRGEQRFLQRMVFEDVKPRSLRWLWQRSDDDGRTWKTQWEIAYRRAQ
ncbi:MAG TPA: hypothetical protein VFE23_05390 [Usitatibacter sp.]|jgi:hypothetical protein|nr:hypothetical protein [Usitatibacter sp.]